MSVAANITISKDTATDAIAAKLAKCSPERLGKIVGAPLTGFFRRHLASLGTNKRGWPSTGFYEGASRAVQSTAVANGCMLRCDWQGLRQRWKGGAITPQSAKALTIPISPVSYGHRASEFPGLFLLTTKRGAYLAQRGEGISEKSGRITGIGKQGRGNSNRRLRANLNFLFKLSKGVNQKPNPNVIPTEDQFLEVAMAAIDKEIK